MVLFKNNQDLAGQLMSSFHEWLAQSEETGSPEKEELIEWLARRKSLGGIGSDVTNRSRDNPKRRWLYTLVGVEGKSHLRVYAEYSCYPILPEFLFSNGAEP